jgi:DNA-binding LytR/AlgR family response regulator
MSPHEKFIVLRNQQVIQKIDKTAIVAIEGCGYCSTFVMENNTRFTISKNLKEIEKLLFTPPIFLRVSKSVVVNMNKIQKIHTEKRVVHLDGNKEYLVSARKMKELTDRLITINGQNGTLNQNSLTLVGNIERFGYGFK